MKLSGRLTGSHGCLGRRCSLTRRPIRANGGPMARTRKAGATATSPRSTLARLSVWPPSGFIRPESLVDRRQRRWSSMG